MTSDGKTLVNDSDTISMLVGDLQHELVEVTKQANTISLLDQEAHDKILIILSQLHSNILALRKVISTHRRGNFPASEQPYTAVEYQVFHQKIKIGEMAKGVFQFLFHNHLLTQDDIDFLCSEASVSFFKTRRTECTLLRLNTGSAKDIIDSSGRKRYYPHLQLVFNKKSYYLTKELWDCGMESMTRYFCGFGLSLNDILNICNPENGEAKPTSTIQDSESPTTASEKIRTSHTKIKESGSSQTVEPNRDFFPYKVGSLAQILFPILFSRKLVSAQDVEYLQSEEAIKLFKTRGNTVLVSTSVPEEHLWKSGHKRFYVDLQLAFENRTYYLTSQFFPQSLNPLLEFLMKHGIGYQEILDLCKEGKAKPRNVVTLENPIYPIEDQSHIIEASHENVVDCHENAKDINDEYEVITIKNPEKMHSSHFNKKK